MFLLTLHCFSSRFQLEQPVWHQDTSVTGCQRSFLGRLLRLSCREHRTLLGSEQNTKGCTWGCTHVSPLGKLNCARRRYHIVIHVYHSLTSLINAFWVLGGFFGFFYIVSHGPTLHSLNTNLNPLALLPRIVWPWSVLAMNCHCIIQSSLIAALCNVLL